MTIGLRKKHLLAASRGGAPTVPRTGLISYWKLKEVSGTRVDSHGTNHLTPGNNPVGSSEGCDFERDSAQYLSCASNATLTPGDTDFTIAAWVKIESDSGVNNYIVAKDSDVGREYALNYKSTGFMFELSGGNPNVVDSATPAFGTWYFLVAWFNATLDTMNLQVNNGTALSAPSTTAFPGPSVAQFRIGSRAYPGFEHYFDGIIKEVAFYNRVLTPAERTTLWNGGTSITY